MSMQTAVLCSICNEVFNNGDIIFGTSCGHLYHLICLPRCHTESAKCPNCDFYKPCIFKMCLEFGNTPSYESQERIVSLNENLEFSNNKIAELSEKCRMLQLQVQKLDGKLKKLDDANNSKTIMVSNLEDKIKSAEIMNEYLTKELELLRKIRKSNISQLDEQNFSGCVNTQKINGNSITENNENYNCQNGHNNESNGLAENFSHEYKETKSVISENENDDCSNKREDEGLKLDTSNTNKLLICNYPIKLIEKYSAMSSVQFVARKLEMQIPTKAFKRVISIKTDFSTANLIVEFSHLKYKKSFLKNRTRLKTVRDLQNVEICEYSQ